MSNTGLMILIVSSRQPRGGTYHDARFTGEHAEISGVHFLVQGHVELVCGYTGISTRKLCSNSPGLTASEEDGGVSARRHVPVLLGKYSGYTQVT